MEECDIQSANACEIAASLQAPIGQGVAGKLPAVKNEVYGSTVVVHASPFAPIQLATCFLSQPPRTHLIMLGLGFLEKYIPNGNDWE